MWSNTKEMLSRACRRWVADMDQPSWVPLKKESGLLGYRSRFESNNLLLNI
jgi:hypothetical protein